MNSTTKFSLYFTVRNTSIPKQQGQEINAARRKPRRSVPDFVSQLWRKIGWKAWEDFARDTVAPPSQEYIANARRHYVDRCDFVAEALIVHLSVH